MYLTRVLFKRRNIRRLVWITCFLFVFITFRMSFMSMVAEEPPFQSVRARGTSHNTNRITNRINNRVTNADRSVCSIPNHLTNSTHSDTYTYDLPDITEYRLLEKNQEYAIPVKSEKEAAYGSNLEEVKVFIVPFSHVDPGYGNTMEGYYRSRTKETLNSMVRKLEQYKNLTFQWAETVFLERWWRDISGEVKEKVRQLIRSGQLEIVLGGWVMPDEASTHYVSVIDQLIEGHQWLIENLSVKPKNSWSNDPFGYSSTMPYLWKQTGMENMVILRIHQAIKGTLMKKKSLEFFWKQYWSSNDDSNILCHIMPYRGYWIGDVCGPYNQHICREYAFMHTEPIHKVVFVNEENLAERARILYEQYRITADLYQHKSLYIGLGEDFSYSQAGDWDRIYKNYEMLMNYINAKKEWKMNVKFGTLAEYFESIRQDQKQKTAIDGSRFPVLSGDFFPYSDYRNDYWSGYYTTRPFNKRLSREIQALMRTADIFNSYAYSSCKHWDVPYSQYDDVTKKLRAARRELGMFLHHDGITGTSVQSVISDFQSRLYGAYKDVKSALKSIIATLLKKNKQDLEISLNDIANRPSGSSESVPVIVSSSDSVLIAINPTAKERHEVISFSAQSDVDVFDYAGAKLRRQLILSDDPKAKKVYFETELKPLSVDIYSLRSPETTKEAKIVSPNDTIVIENLQVRAEFSSKSGLLTKLMDKRGKQEITFNTEILAYTSQRSGAYIFAPKGEAETFLSDKAAVTLVVGDLVSEVRADYGLFKFRAKLYHTLGVQSKGLHIETELDIKQMKKSDKEVIIRMKTDVTNKGLFYTDQNGFQMMGRKNYPDRPVEQNYYPVTSMVTMECRSRRLTLHAAQPHGVASYREGWLEVMLDRIVSRDDGKGLGQGVQDNRVAIGNFILQVEAKNNPDIVEESRYTFPSTTSMLLNDILLNPIQMLVASSGAKSAELTPFTPVSKSLPCNVFIVGMRNLAKSDLSYNGTSLVLHKRAAHCGYEQTTHNCDQEHIATIGGLFKYTNMTKTFETTLSHLYTTTEVKRDDDLSPDENELRAFKVDL